MKNILKLFTVIRKCDGNEKQHAEVDENSISYAQLGKYLIPLIIAILSALLGYNLNMFSFIVISPESIISFILSALAIVCVIFSFIKIVNTFYMSDDLSVLLAMPFSEFQITFSKLLVIAARQYLIAAVLIIPFCIGFSLSSTISLRFIAGALTGLLTIPAIMLALTGIIIMLLMRFVRFIRNKNLLKVIGVLIVMAASVGVSLMFMFNGEAPDQSHDSITMSVQIGVALSAMFANIMPMVTMISSFVTGGSVLMLVAVFAIAVALLALFALVAKLTYIKSALSMTNSSHSAKALTNSSIYKASAKRSVVTTYTAKDLKTILRTPAFLMRSVLNPVIVPVLFVLVIAFTCSGTMSEFFKGNGTLVFILFNIVSFVSLFSIGCSDSITTAFSKEGQSFFFMKSMPIDYKTQLKAKRNASLVISLAATTVVLLISGIVLAIMGVVNVFHIIFALIISICIMVICADLGVFYDTAKPSFSWESEDRIRSGNLFGTILLVAGLMFSVLITTATALIKSIFAIESFNSLLLMTVLCILYIAIAFVINKLFYKLGTKNLKKL